ncbi:Glutathione S-transferase S1 [Linnemannia hyalina]|uniref:glutathione transferase n=1 Tax=Linnemannia hyalina TaxID=64524 RepID=A0A9P8BRU7_9FUNG|nr:Glutathione S-transferase S1 [Linnemannia hyalina]
MVHAYFNPAQAAAFNALATTKGSTFEIKYFNIHGLGGVTRTLLAISGNKFTSNNPEDWASEKPLAPFGVMPLLTETSADGKTIIQIAESDAIERYLANKFGLLGSNTFEEVLVNTFVSNNHSLQSAIFSKYLINKDPELKAANKEPLITSNIAPWIKYHEQHLVANGANGHYVGNKVTLADVTTDFLIGLIQGVTGEELVSKSKTPAIWEVREKLNKIEGLAAWKQTEEFKMLSEKNFAVLGFY